MDLRTRLEIIVQSANVGNLNICDDRRLRIRRIKRTRLRWMRIKPHIHLERALDIAYRGADIQQHSVRMSASDDKAISPGKIDDALIILRSRSKTFRELLWRPIMMVFR